MLIKIKENELCYQHPFTNIFFNWLNFKYIPLNLCVTYTNFNQLKTVC